MSLPEVNPTVSSSASPGRGFDLARLPLVRKLLLNRWPQFLVTGLALGGFLLAILSGLFGTPVGSRNFGIIFVWIVWWALLMLVAVPLFGRGWCSICPIPAPGDWLQRGMLLGPDGAPAGRGLGKRWPKKLRNIWIQNSAFTLIALFSTVILTQPRLTAVVLAAFLFIAVGASLIYERRAFCRYLCPVGGFIGLYAQLAPTELRVISASVCAAHTEKTCYTGNAEGYGCPWGVFPGGLVKNTYCGACMECLRTCPHDNIAIRLRPFGADLAHPSGRKLDEVYKAFIMLGSALLYSLVLLGPWGALKSAAYAVGSLPWLAYAAFFLLFVLAALPGLFYLAVLLGRRLAGVGARPRRQIFVHLGYALVPLGLTAWIAFSLAFVFTNFSYVWPALSDPFGWGWDLFGTVGTAWTPYLGSALPVLQAGVLVGGFIWSSLTARRLAGEALPADRATRLALPVILYCLGITLGLFGLLIA
jgi:polyferredoxin